MTMARWAGRTALIIRSFVVQTCLVGRSFVMFAKTTNLWSKKNLFNMARHALGAPKKKHAASPASQSVSELAEGAKRHQTHAELRLSIFICWVLCCSLLCCWCLRYLVSIHLHQPTTKLIPSSSSHDASSSQAAQWNMRALVREFNIDSHQSWSWS